MSDDQTPLKSQTDQQVTETPEDTEVDINQIIKAEVSEAIGPVTEKLANLESKFVELIDEVKKKRTVLKISGQPVKRETLEEQIDREVSELWTKTKAKL